MKAVAVNVPVSAQKTALLHTGIVLYAPLIKEQNFHIMVLFHDNMITDRQTDKWTKYVPCSTYPYLAQISLSPQIKVSTILLFLLAQEWKKRQTNYP